MSDFKNYLDKQLQDKEFKEESGRRSNLNFLLYKP